jgi:hypothetical protein
VAAIAGMVGSGTPAKNEPSQLTIFAAADISTRNRKKSDLGC